MSTFDNMVKFLDTAWCAKDTIVPCLIGTPGIGKTQAVLQHAANVGAGKVVTIIASQILPNEVSGITMPVNETKSMEIFDHYRLSSLEDGDILFFDELLEADQLVLSACLTLIESRQMMSGRKLPDIQIVAATNPTITADMLKGSIRQRFLFRKFDMDKQGCRAYILHKYHLDIGANLMNMIVEDGHDYNVLTQRSMTKMVEWICRATSDDEAVDISQQISASWNCGIGNELLHQWRKAFNNPEQKVRSAIADLVTDQHPELDDELFHEATLKDIMEVLQGLEDWDEIAKQLDSMVIEEEDDQGISF